MKKAFSIALSCAAAAFAAAAPGEEKFVSPDGRLAAVFSGRTLSVSYDGERVVEVGGFADGAGTRFRCTDAGIAWQTPGDRGAYTFDFAADARCWPVSHAQGKYAPLLLSQIGSQAPMPAWAPVAAGVGRMYNYAQEFQVEGSCEAPLVVEPQGFCVALGDAAVYGGARLRFVKGDRTGRVASYLEGPYPGMPDSWKYVRVARTPAELAAGNGFELQFCAPSAIADTSFVKSGKVLRVMKLDTQIAREAVDFAKRRSMQFIEIDCGWYGQEHAGDPTRPGLAPERVARGEQFDLFAVLDYAKRREVPVILYVNRVPLERNAAEILDRLKEWGVAGVKFGFVPVGSGKNRAWVFELVKAAAERRLMVDIHDEFRLTGEQRTYPNVMTVEGVHGNEEMPTADHNAALVYTRYLTGPGDYTPCWRIGRVKNSPAHQLALPIVYDSPWQFLYWYSKPSEIADEPALAVWDEMPAVFDETRHLQGSIGEYAVVARRQGTKWFVGCLNAGEPRRFDVPTGFAAPAGAALRVRLFRDGGGDAVAAETFTLRAGEPIRTEAAANGGWVAILESAVPEDAVYQWAADVEGVVSKETQKPPRAYLWLPPDAAQVRAVVLGMHNMLEEPVFAHPDFRAGLARAQTGICWITPMVPQRCDRLPEEEIAAIERLFARLAETTGHPELATVPLVPFGHSAMATFPYLFAAARPRRTLAAISIKGEWPTPGRPCWEPAQAAAREHVPLLLVSGEYEDGYGRREKARDLMAKIPDATFSMWIDVGGGHFDWSDELCAALGRWIAAMARRPPVAAGVVRNGFWYPDRELADLVADYERLPRGRGRFSVLGYEVGGRLLEQNPKAHLQVVFGAGGTEFEVKPVFDPKVPPGRPETWTGLPAGAANPLPVDAAARQTAIALQKIQGPVEYLGGNRWGVRYNRYDPAGRRAREASLQMVYPGDAGFKRSVQQALVRVKPPRTDFRDLGEKPARIADFPLALPEGAGAYVREGPARVVDGRVELADVPAAGELPPVTLVVYDPAGERPPELTTLRLAR